MRGKHDPPDGGGRNGYADVGILRTPQLGVADLYVELALVRAHEAQEELRECPDSSITLSQGAQCLTDAVAALRDAAGRLNHAGGTLDRRLEALADDLLVEAATFEQTADLIRVHPDLGGR